MSEVDRTTPSVARSPYRLWLLLGLVVVAIAVFVIRNRRTAPSAGGMVSQPSGTTAGDARASFDFWLTVDPLVSGPGDPSASLDWRVASFGQGARFRVSDTAVPASDIAQIVLVRPGGVRRTDELWNTRPELNKLAFDLHVPSREPGTAVVALKTKPVVTAVSAVEFERYLRMARLDRIVAERERLHETGSPARDRFIPEPKGVIRIGDGTSAGEACSATIPLGPPLALEIVPARDPYSIRVGDALPIRVLLHGQPLSGVVVSATFVGYAGPAGTYAWSGTSDSAGLVAVPISAGGAWLGRGAHMIRLDRDPDADWESYWASLTFEAAPKAPAAERR